MGPQKHSRLGTLLSCLKQLSQKKKEEKKLTHKSEPKAHQHAQKMREHIRAKGRDQAPLSFSTSLQREDHLLSLSELPDRGHTAAGKTRTMLNNIYTYYIHPSL